LAEDLGLPVLTASEDLGLAVLKGLPVLIASEDLGLAVLKGLPVLTASSSTCHHYHQFSLS